jgi:O-antigen ligase
MPALLFGAFVTLLLMVRTKDLQLYFVQNIDILLFCVVLFLGIINAEDQINATLYAVWNSAAFVCMLSYFYQIRKRSRTVRWWSLFQIVFWSNSIVLLLLVVHLHTLGTEWGYYMAFSEKFFYPYCLLSMLMSIYGTQLFCDRSIYSFKSDRLNAGLQLFTIFLIFLFIFLGARRAVLFVGLFISFPYMFYAVGQRYWKKLSLFLLIAAFLIVTIPIVITYMSEYETEFKILKKLSDIQEAGGDISKDSSYGERQKIWVQYWQIVEEHPIIGVGAYNSRIVQEIWFEGTDTEGYSTHNLFMGVLVEHGFTGLTMLVVIMLRSLWISFRRLPLRSTLIYGFYIFIPILAINWNEYNLIPGQVFYWSTFLFLVAPRMFMTKIAYKQ